MAPIPGAGGARYAPRGVMRVLLRVVLLSGLLVVAWLLGSGISHADEDLGQPGNGLIHMVNVVSSDDGSSEGVGTPAAIAPIVKKVLPAAPALGNTAPRLPVQPPAQLNILRPIASAAGVAKPLNQVLPVSRPLPLLDQQAVPAQRTDALLASAPAGQSAAPGIAGRSAAAAPEVSPLVHNPAAVPCSAAQDSPAQFPADPPTIQPALGNAPLSPMPANPPGNTTSLCTVGGSAGGAGGKNGSDFAVHDSGVTGGIAAPHGPLDREASEFPLALALQPSTSPD